MSPNTSAGLSYLCSWITGLIFLLSEKQSRFVRFHALQSLFYTGAYVVISYIFDIIKSAVPTMDASGNYTPIYTVVDSIGILLLLLSFAFWLVCMICAFRGKYFKLPLIGNWALRIANRPKRG